MARICHLHRDQPGCLWKTAGSALDVMDEQMSTSREWAPPARGMQTSLPSRRLLCRMLLFCSLYPGIRLCSPRQLSAADFLALGSPSWGPVELTPELRILGARPGAGSPLLRGPCPEGADLGGLEASWGMRITSAHLMSLLSENRKFRFPPMARKTLMSNMTASANIRCRLPCLRRDPHLFAPRVARLGEGPLKGPGACSVPLSFGFMIPAVSLAF